MPDPIYDRVMNHSFWIGVYPGMTGERKNYIIQKDKRVREG